MEKIKTYVINLETSKVRKQYMIDLLKPYDFFDVEFVKAVDGRKLSEEECASRFDDNACLKLLGRQLNRGEIGCTLSHFDCCKALLESQSRYALILEDDIALMRDLNELQNYDLDKCLDTDIPTILFLSGDFWYYKYQSVTSVFDAVGAYAYFINRAAAKLKLSMDSPYYVADAWYLFRRKGIELKAIIPYMIDANINMGLLSSDVAQDQWGLNRRKMSVKNIVLSYYDSLIKKVMKKLGHFESKIRVINNVIVDE